MATIVPQPVETVYRIRLEYLELSRDTVEADGIRKQKTTPTLPKLLETL